jgi:hypothetical protein
MLRHGASFPMTTSRTVTVFTIVSAAFFLLIPYKIRLNLAMKVFDSPLGFYFLKYFKSKKEPHRLQPRQRMKSGHFEIFILPCLESNYAYAIVDWELMTAVVVDPSDSARIIRFLQIKNIKLIGILNTHKHWDHTGGNSDLIAMFPSVEVVGHELDFAKTSRQKLYQGVNKWIKGGDKVILGRLVFNVLWTPAHTLGSVMYLLDTMESIALSGMLSADSRV